MNCYEVCGLELVRLQNIKLNLNFRFGKINRCVCISLILLVPTLPGLPPPPAVLHTLIQRCQLWILPLKKKDLILAMLHSLIFVMTSLRAIGINDGM